MVSFPAIMPSFNDPSAKGKRFYWVGMLLCLLLILLVLGIQLWLVRVTRTYPADTSQVSSMARIGIQFSQPMRAASVEAAFSLDPAVPGKLSWEGNTLWFTPLHALQPGITYTARLSTIAQPRKGLLLGVPVAWRFTVRQPQIVYMAPAGEARELYRLALDGSPPIQLTHSGGKVLDYVASPDGEWLAYSQANSSGGADLWRVARDGGAPQELVACGKDRCSMPAWSPDSKQIAYSLEKAGEVAAAGWGPGRIWILTDLATRLAGPLYTAPQVWGSQPVWSPDGRRLAFYDGSTKAVRVFDFQTAQAAVLQTLEESAGSWSPDGSQLVYNDLHQVGDALQGTLYLADFSTGSIAPLFSGSLADDDFGQAAWSPAGQWIAMGVRSLSESEGRQVWLVNPVSGAVQKLTHDPLSAYSAIQWDPEGSRLVFQRYPLGSSASKPEIMEWDGEKIISLVEDATQPAWLP